MSSIRNFIAEAYGRIKNWKLSSMTDYRTLKYEDIKALTNDKNSFLIDVREPAELKQTGTLPGSINIPVSDVENVLKNMTGDEFLKKYGRNKPALDDSLVFSCQSGKRSMNALMIAKQLGYTNLSNYGGGWLDWNKHNK